MTDEIRQRVRTGVFRDADGWWVIQEIDGEVTFYGQPATGKAFHDEGLADIGAHNLALLTRRVLGEHGVDIREA